MKRWWLWLIFGLLLVGSVSAQYSPGGFTPFGGNFGDALNNILDWFTDNPGWIDALVLLVVFLVLGKSVFKEYFKSKALYVTVAVALTVGVLLWERQSGVSLILNSGPAGLVILAVAAFMWFFLFIKHSTGLGYFAFAITYAVFYYYMVYLTNYRPGAFPNWFYDTIDYFMFNFGVVLDIILAIVIIFAIISIFKILFGGKPEYVRRRRDED